MAIKSSPKIDNADDDEVLTWLLEGDPAIRWQVMRDLLDAPPRKWKAERQRVETEGWGAHLLAAQDREGTWSQSLYGNPKWTCTTYTLLQLRDIGLRENSAAAIRGCRAILDRGVPGQVNSKGKAKIIQSLQRLDTCV